MFFIETGIFFWEYMENCSPSWNMTFTNQNFISSDSYYVLNIEYCSYISNIILLNPGPVWIHIENNYMIIVTSFR